MTLLLCSCAASNKDYDSRFLEKYLLDAERSLQENDPERAERLLRQSVAHGEKLSAGDWKLALAEGRLGRVLLDNHKDAEAKTVLIASISHFRSLKDNQSGTNIVSKEHGEADSLLGLMLLDAGDINGARPYLEEASALLAPYWPEGQSQRERDTISGIGYARALYGLARIKQHDKDVDAAGKNYARALVVIDEERISVPLRDDIALAYAKLLKSKGEHDKALEVEQAQDEYERFNPGGPKAIARDAWRHAYNQARETSKQGDAASADRSFAEAMKQVNLYEKDGEDSLQTLCEWSRVKQKMNDAAAANRLLSQAEAMAIRLGGDKSVDYDNFLLAKDRVFKLQHNYEGLETVLKQQIALRETLRGKDNYHVGETLTHLAECYVRMNKFPEAESEFRKAIAIFELKRQRNFKAIKEAYDELIPVLEKQQKLEDVRKFKFDRAVLVKDTIKWENEQSER